MTIAIYVLVVSFLSFFGLLIWLHGFASGKSYQVGKQLDEEIAAFRTKQELRALTTPDVQGQVRGA